MEKTLKARWRGEEQRVSAIVEDLRDNRDWTRHLLVSGEGAWGILDGLETCPKERLSSEVAPRDLRGIVLKDVDLSFTQSLADTALDYAEVRGVNLRGASLVGSSMRRFRASDGTVLDGADLQFADLSGAELREISMSEANLANSDISGADFRDSEIRACIFLEVKFLAEKTMGFLGLGDRATRFGGPLQRRERLGTELSMDIRRHIEDQNRIYELERQFPVFSRLSYWLTNFGQSPTRLLFWVLVVWLGFASLYLDIALPLSLQDSKLGALLTSCDPVVVDSSTGLAIRDPIRALYFSASALTTLVYGDTVPKPGNVPAQVSVSVEAFLGYVLLGALVSLFLQTLISRD